jgi:hypothetical protein
MKLIAVIISIATIHGYIVDSASETLNQQRAWASRGSTGIDAKIKKLVNAIVATQNKETTDYHPKFL